MQERQGGCLCGAVRYMVKGEPQMIGLCHCTHCQKQSGSVFSFNVFYNEDNYEQHGETTFYLDTGDSGKPSLRHFCGNCGSPIFTTDQGLPGIVIVKAGTLDSMEGLYPQAEIYTDRAAQWIAPFEGTRRFPRAPSF